MKWQFAYAIVLGSTRSSMQKGMWNVFTSNSILTGARAGKALIFVFATAVLLLSAVTVSAQNVEVEDPAPLLHKNIHYFQPPTDGSGLIGVWGSEPIGHLGFRVATYADYVQQPLEWTRVDDNNTYIVIYDSTAVQGHFGFGLLGGISVSGAVDYTAARNLNDELAGFPAYLDIPDEAVMGDSRVAIKYSFRNRRFDCMGVAAMVEIGLPTGQVDSYVSDEVMSVAPRLIWDLGNTWWTVFLNVGAKIYTGDLTESTKADLETGNELLWAAGATFRLFRFMSLFGDIESTTLLTNPYGVTETNYAEAHTGLRFGAAVDNPVNIDVGAGFGAADGIGTPVWRMYLGVGWTVRALGLP